MASIDGIPGPLAGSMTPQEMQAFYGVNSNLFSSLQGQIQGNGAGQTIAIVDAYDDPNLLSDLTAFDTYFNLPAPPSFTKYSETGSTTSLPKASTNGWSVEESLDVEWAHVIAPAASIDLVEATTQIFQTDMIAAVKEAASLPGVSVVSMSFGYPELPTSQSYNSDFVTPAGHQGVTFVSATSDIGSFGKGGIDPYSGQPAFLSNVVSVGGTSLAQQSGFPTLETAWNQGGGGISQYVSEPSYQLAVQNTGKRTAPDVSMDANPAFGGVAVYDSYDFGLQNPWNQIGGTSLATPMWAATIAIANQGRTDVGADTLDGTAAGPQQTLQALYSLPYSDFNNVVGGGNEGFVAKAGYNLSTGLGSPKANLLVRDLAAYGLTSQAAVTTNVVNITVPPPQSVEPGATFGFAAAVQDAYGNTDVSFQGQAVVTLSDGTPVTSVNVVNGVAVIDRLTLGSGQSASYTVTITGNGFTGTGQPVSVTATPTSSLTLYPAPSFSSLTSALNSAAANTQATNIVIQLEAGTYQLSNTAAATLLIENTGTSSTKTITIRGAGENSTFIVPIIPQGWTSSIFTVVGTGTKGPVSVNIEGLTIENGLATNGGVTGKNAALGGAILIDGGNVMLSNVGLVNDRAVGRVGSTPAPALRKLPGNKAGAGTAAAGGALYMAGGTLTLNTVSFIGDLARGGRGGTGGIGGSDG
ncbi:MAG: S53 family peptidase, partial [Isosphaeraceae bacterium]